MLADKSLNLEVFQSLLASYESKTSGSFHPIITQLTPELKVLRPFDIQGFRHS
jgi:hypothetical protein